MKTITQLINLLSIYEIKHGLRMLNLQLYNDESGCIRSYEEEIFEFESIKELEEKLLK